MILKLNLIKVLNTKLYHFLRRDPNSDGKARQVTPNIRNFIPVWNIHHLVLALHFVHMST